MKKKPVVWVVVADEAIARILERPEDGGELQPVEELTDPAAHARGADARRDALGRRAGSAPAGSRNSGGSQHRLRGEAGATASAGEDNEHLEAESFARQVAQRLAEHRQRQAFDELRIVAAPKFLGLLRKALPNQVAATVGDDLNKDLIHESNRSITERLFGPLAEADR